MANYEKGPGGFVQKKTRRKNKPTNTKIFRPETVKILEKGVDRETEIPNFAEVTEDPVFACFVIDASPSMSPYRDDVIKSHPVMIDTLRASAKCKNDALYVIQYIFSKTPVRLHPFEKLDARQQDKVAVLNSSNYNPDKGDSTSLYDTVFDLLKEMSVCIEQGYEDGIKSTFSIAVISDGEDNTSKINPADIRSVIEELRDKRYLRSSIVLGLLNKQFSKQRLEEIKNVLGFEKAVPLDRDPKSIRRAFELASRSSVS